MNTENTNTAEIVRQNPEPPAFALYHPSGRGNGCAVQLRLVPATADRDGAAYLTTARQLTVANPADPAARFASFDWANKSTVKLTPLELAEILMVFGGQAPSLVHAGKDGLYHSTPAATTSVALKRSEDPVRPGFLLGVGRTPKADPNARQYHAFTFTPSEACLLRFALSAKMGALCFGE